MICSIQSFIRRIKLIVIIALSITIAFIDALPFGGTWRQVGTDIDGTAQNDQSGFTVAMSADGKTIVIGAPYNDNTNGEDSGHVRVYSIDSSTGNWTRIGSDINGKAAFDRFGWSVCISDDGKTIAAGAFGNDNANGMESGHVRVYSYNLVSKMWTQVGSDINGEVVGYQSVDMSADGTTIAIGALNNNNTNGVDAGYVRVFTINTTLGTWTQVGLDIDGKTMGDFFGYSLALSSNATTIAVGAPYNDNANGASAGHVRVFSNNNVTSRNWTQVGLDINGKASGVRFGWSVAISSDGKTIAIGAPYNNNMINSNVEGSVRVYSLNATSSSWTQVGLDVNGVALNYLSGFSVAMSADGKTIAIGAPLNDDANRTDTGHVRVYSINSTSGNWTQVGLDITGEASNDYSGFSVALSNDGFTIAIGTPFNNNINGIDAGHVRVYKYELPPTKAPTRTPTKSPTKPPTKFPTRRPTKAPSKIPTKFPTTQPTKTPTKRPTKAPSKKPTKNPTKAPSQVILPVPIPIMVPIQVPLTSPVSVPTNCGLFGLNFFCPRRGECGFWRRLLNLHGC